MALTTGENKFGYIKDGKVFVKGYLGLPDREIGDVKTTPEAAIAYFENRFELLKTRISNMVLNMKAAENKGSFMMQTKHLKDLLKSFNALGDFETLDTILQNLENSILNIINDNREKNASLKLQLLSDAKSYLQLEDPKERMIKLKEFRQSWVLIGSVPDEKYEAIEAEYQFILSEYDRLKQIYIEFKENQYAEREAELRELINRLRKFNSIRDSSILNTEREFKRIDEEWKHVGNVPKPIYEALIEEFKMVKKDYQRNVRRYKKPPSREPKRIYIPKYYPPHEAHLYDNLKVRLELIEEAKSLQRMDSRVANERAKDLQMRWKNAGFIPEQYKNEVYFQFNQHCDRVFELNNLMRTIFTTYSHFTSRPQQEQLEIKIQTMREIIAKEEQEIERVQNMFEMLNPDEKDNPENKSIYLRLSTSKRKFKAKQKLLEEIQRENRGGGQRDNYNRPDSRPPYQPKRY